MEFVFSYICKKIYIWLALLLPYMLASIMEIFLSAIYIYIYIYCGWGEAKDGMETVGLARGGKKAHLRINPGSTYRLELEEER